MHRVIVVGSPRPNGRSAALAEELFNACIEECPEDGVSIVSVASLEVGACRACDACKLATQAPEKLPEGDDNLAIMPFVAQSDALLHRCVIHDDMTDVRKHIDAADELIVVSPVYFASAPAQLKCLMDRLQPYYWSNLRKQGRRPMVLHVVGEGGDPHGFEPLIGTVRSAFGAVGFDLELVLDWVGKIDESGEIVAEAQEYPLPPVGGFAGFVMDGNEFEIVEEDGVFADEDDLREELRLTGMYSEEELWHMNLDDMLYLLDIAAEDEDAQYWDGGFDDGEDAFPAMPADEADGPDGENAGFRVIDFEEASCAAEVASVRGDRSASSDGEALGDRPKLSLFDEQTKMRGQEASAKAANRGASKGGKKKPQGGKASYGKNTKGKGAPKASKGGSGAKGGSSARGGSGKAGAGAKGGSGRGGSSAKGGSGKGGKRRG